VGPNDKNEFGPSDGWAKTVHVKVGVGVAQVVDYLAQAVNLPSWAIDFCQEILVGTDDHHVLTPHGWARLRIETNVEAGVVDLVVAGPEGVAGTYYMRAVGLGEATSLVSFTWLRPSHLTWEQFDTDWHYLQAELDQLADCLEGSGGSE